METPNARRSLIMFARQRLSWAAEDGAMTFRAGGNGTTRWWKATPGLLIVTLSFAACDGDLRKTWNGGRIEAKVSAERCPDAGVAVSAPKNERAIVGECKEYSEGEFSVLTRLHIVETLENGERSPRDRDQVWSIGCFAGLCEAATLDGAALAGDDPLQPFQLGAWRGAVVSGSAGVFKLKFTGMADQAVTVDLPRKLVHYRQTFKSGKIAVGEGSCAGSIAGGLRR
jgi:hypothetical protein